MFENIGHGLESSRIAGGEQQSKRTQSESSSRSRRNWGAAAEADAIGDLLKRMQSRSGRKQRAAAEADAIEEQQLCTESCPAPDYSHRRMRGK